MSWIMPGTPTLIFVTARTHQIQILLIDVGKCMLLFPLFFVFQAYNGETYIFRYDILCAFHILDVEDISMTLDLIVGQ